MERKLPDMLAKIEGYNLAAYQQLLQLFECYDDIEVLFQEGPTRKARRRLLCANSKEYLAAGHIYIMPILNHFCDNRELFSYFITTLEAKADVPEYVQLYLAEDLIHFLFNDYNSGRTGTIRVLRQIEFLYKVCKQLTSRRCLSATKRDWQPWIFATIPSRTDCSAST